jgi:hypothetical protein
MKKIFFLGAIIAAIFGAKKLMSGKQEDEFAPDDTYATAA